MSDFAALTARVAALEATQRVAGATTEGLWHRVRGLEAEIESPPTASREPDADNFLDGVVAASRSKGTGGIADVEALARAVEAANVRARDAAPARDGETDQSGPCFATRVATGERCDRWNDHGGEHRFVSDAIPRAAVEALADEIKFGRVRFQEEIVERLMALASPEVQR